MCCLYVYVCYNRCLIIVSMSAIYMCMYVTMGVLLLVQCMLSICVCMLQWVSYYCFNVFCLYAIYICLSRSLMIKWGCLSRSLMIKWGCLSRSLMIKWGCLGRSLMIKWGWLCRSLMFR